MSIYSVSQLNEIIKEGIAQFDNYTLKGQISNYKFQNKCAFLTLKDKHAQIKAIIYHPTILATKFPLDNNLDVIAYGQLQFWQGRGEIVFLIMRISKVGVNDHLAIINELIGRLTVSGHLQKQKKLVLPQYPQKIGVIAALAGKAIDDVTTRIKERWPYCRINFYYSAVQGKQALSSLINNLLQAEPAEEIIILARGGGSQEDLNIFNAEELALTIANLTTPVITGIGHESDKTIADLVAYDFGITPTAAVDKALPYIVSLKQELNKIKLLLNANYRKRLTNYKLSLLQFHKRLQECKNKITFSTPTTTHIKQIAYQLDLLYRKIIAHYYSKLFLLKKRIITNYNIQITKKQNQLSLLKQKLSLIAPDNILKKGYAIVSFNDKIITNANQLSNKQRLKITFSDSYINVITDKGEKE